MKKYIMYVLSGIVVLAASCNKNETMPVSDNEDQQVTPELITISAQLTDETKASVNGTGVFYWTKDEDQVAYYTSEGWKTSGTASVSAQTTNFTILDLTRSNYAVFPSYIITDSESSGTHYGGYDVPLDVKLKGEYTLAEVSGEKTPCPMISPCAGESWNFIQLCGMLRLRINSIAPSATKITIDFNNKQVHGDFSIAYPIAVGTSVIATTAVTAESNLDVITITLPDHSGAWLNDVVISLPLPVGSYDNIVVTQLSGSTPIMKMSRPIMNDGTAYAATRAQARVIGAGFPVVSVSSTKKVVYAPGTLQASNGGGSWSWHFVDYLTVASHNLSGNVNRFGYSTALSSYGLSNSTDNEDYGGAFIDWGKNVIDGDPADTWRCLSKTEFEYMANTRATSTVGETANARWTSAVIGGLNCVIVFPDNYTHPATAPALSLINQKCTYGQTISATAWKAMRYAGCVAYATRYSEGGVTNQPLYVFSWLSDANGSDKAWVAHTNGNCNFLTYGLQRHYGASVQLVREIN